VQSLAGLTNLNRLLDERGMSPARWREKPQTGFSGARIYTQDGPDGSSYVLKVTSPGTDWIMRATADHDGREAALANALRIRDDRVSSPAIAAARDGAVSSILMHDISAYLLSNDGLDHQQLDAIWRGMARLHALAPPGGGQVAWCPVADRLTLFEPDPGKLRTFRIGADILRGWELFFARAPAHVTELVRSLFDDIGPLAQALGQLPSRFLHGDLKLDNIGILPSGALALIDWSMPMVAPAAIELGWFLAMNSRALPVSLDDAVAAYTAHSGMGSELRERHESLTALCGLLIRGWRKGLDAEAGEPAELRWWCERAASAAKLL
jgi:hypothetical protein